MFNFFLELPRLYSRQRRLNHAENLFKLKAALVRRAIGTGGHARTAALTQHFQHFGVMGFLVNHPRRVGTHINTNATCRAQPRIDRRNQGRALQFLATQQRDRPHRRTVSLGNSFLDKTGRMRQPGQVDAVSSKIQGAQFGVCLQKETILG